MAEDPAAWAPAAVKSVLANSAAAFGYKIVDTGIPTGSVDPWGTPLNIGTAWYDKVNPGSELGQWIDKIGNSEFAAEIADKVVNPGLHRVWFGHDFATNLGPVIDQFGAGSIPEYIGQLLKDALTTSGIPFPGVELLVRSGAVSDRVATDWLSTNVGEVFGGGLAFLGTYKLYRASKADSLTKPRVIFATVGIGIKLVAGVLTAQPFLILSGLADTAILITNLDQVTDAFKKGAQVAKTQPSPKAVAEVQGVKVVPPEKGAKGPAVRGAPVPVVRTPAAEKAPASPRSRTNARGCWSLRKRRRHPHRRRSRCQPLKPAPRPWRSP